MGKNVPEVIQRCKAAWCLTSTSEGFEEESTFNASNSYALPGKKAKSDGGWGGSPVLIGLTLYKKVDFEKYINI